MSTPKVEVAGLTKRFKIYRTPSGRLVEWLTLGRAVRHSLFTALDDVSFTMKQGEFFGVIGPNGSGKSTLLKILTRVMYPTAGSFRIDGRVTSLLELGTGFNSELTGRENILQSARLLGFDEPYIRARLDAMIAFAEIHEYIEQPIKYYSSGMLVRLAFSIFAHVEPDVFIIDEALSVGDVYFSQKCFRRLDEMRAGGCTVLFVSHDLAAVRKYCDQVLFLHRGRCAYLGDPLAATDVYLETMSPGGQARGLAPGDDGRSVVVRSPAEIIRTARAAFDRAAGVVPELFDLVAFERIAAFGGARIGTGAVRVVALRLSDAAGRAKEQFGMQELIHVDVLAEVLADTDLATMSIQVTNRMGVIVWGTNHQRLTGERRPLRRGTWSHVRFELHPGLGLGEYTLDVGWGDASGEGHVFDRLTAAARLEIIEQGHAEFMGLARIHCRSQIADYEPAAAPRGPAATHS